MKWVGRIGKEAVIAHMQTLLLNFPEQSEENYEKY
jgi:hypothetical protein